MLDLQALAALAAVIEQQSFLQAASKLFITQSAVSQRIKLLERYYGEPVLIRTMPYKPTRLGELLLRYYKQIKLLEDNLTTDLEHYSKKPVISIALSRDSLATWFVSVMDHLHELPAHNLEITSDDQEHTMDYLHKGLVSACASTEAKSLTGCTARFLGYMDYIMVASPRLYQQYFKHPKDLHSSLLQAPAILFDAKDNLHSRYLQHFFNLSDVSIAYHVIPSVAGFRQFALNGYAYALIPEIDVKEDIRNQRLIDLFPNQRWQMPVYWHSWDLESATYNQFNDLVVRISKNILRR